MQRTSGRPMQPAAAVAAKPDISIVIPAYNVAPFVIQAVASALRQSVRNLEVIVVDDGSTDATAALLKHYVDQQADPRLRVVRQDNAGLSAARNTGIRSARADLIGFLDGDDLWRPEKAARHLAAFSADPALGLSFSHSAYLTEAGSVTGTALLARTARPTAASMIRRNHAGNGSTPVVRRACFDRAGLFRSDLRSCEDYEMWCRLLHRTEYTAALVPEILTEYRLRSGSLSFDPVGFIDNAVRAVDHLRRDMPNVPERLFRAGLAEHHRIAAWKAVSQQRRSQSRRLVMKAIALRPMMLLTDWRVGATAVAALLPVGWLPLLLRLRTACRRTTGS